MRSKIEAYLAEWHKRCYFNGVPDQVPIRIEQLNKAPSYRAIVKAIMKNDTTLKTLNFTQTKCNHYHELKRIELAQRNKPIQLRLFP